MKINSLNLTVDVFSADGKPKGLIQGGISAQNNQATATTTLTQQLAIYKKLPSSKTSQ
ncbi:MAG: hypothetical protein Ct9H300mP4_04280 [Gammaproteobacteria bacterium]|nr:MAG: hypothetical protein Ct9H300mP4_04280 [Gammaproteobacteria bacterium]